MCSTITAARAGSRRTAPDLSHVPLIINAPGLRHERRADPVSHVDLMPTLLELTGRPVPGNVDGIALGPLLRTHVAVPARAVFCDIGYEVAAYGPEDFLVAATPQPKSWTLEVFYQEGHAAREHAIAGSDGLTVMQTFNWDGGPTWTARDPAPDLAARLASYLEGSSVIGDPVPLSPADRERLRSLGYGSR